MQQPDDEILKAIIERRRAAQQQQQVPFKPSGFSKLLAKAGGAVEDVAGLGFNKAVKPALGAIEDFSKAVENEPVERVLAIPAFKRIAQGKQPFWFDASKDEATAPGLKLGTPKQVVGRNIQQWTEADAASKRNIPVIGKPWARGEEIAGAGLKGVSDMLLDPTNLLGFGLARKAKVGTEAATEGIENAPKIVKLGHVLAEVAGRGTQSPSAYFRTLAEAGAGSGIGGEVAGQWGSLIGGFGGVWHAATAMERARKVTEANAFEAARVASEKQNFRGYVKDIENGQQVSDVQYPRYQTTDGERTVVDVNGLAKQIAAREASNRISYIPDAEKLSRAENTQALKDLLSVMQVSNTPNILVDDIWDTAKTASKYFQETKGTGELGLKTSQMQQFLADITKGAEKLGDYRYTEEGKGTLRDLIKAQPQPETPEEMLTLYHGTEDPRAMEMLAKGELHPGMFLTSNRELAQSYGPNVFDLQVPKSKLKADDLQMFAGKPAKNYTYMEGGQFDRPNLESLIGQEQNLRGDLQANKEAEPLYKQAFKEAADAKKAYKNEIIQQFPKGSRTAARDYLDSLVQGGDVASAFDRLKRVSKIDIGGGTRYSDLASLPEVVNPKQNMYHGTGAKFEVFNEGFLDGTSLYGPGVYLTDDKSIADSYAKTRSKKTGIPGGVTQGVSVPPDARLLNLEKPFPEDLKKILKLSAQQADDQGWRNTDAWIEAAKAADSNRPGKEVYKAFKENLDELATVDDAAEELELLNQVLSEAGYDGLAHVGGEARGGKRHLVNIIFDPAKAKIGPASPQFSGLDEAAGAFVDLHRAERQAKAELDDLLRGRTDIGASHEMTKSQIKKMVEDQFGQSVKSLQNKLIQIPGTSGRYRVKSFGIKDGQMGVDLEYVSPKSSVEEAIGEGAEATGSRKEALRSARENVRDLRREQAQLRKTGGDVGDIAERIRQAEAEARNLELVRPVGGERPAGTRFVPLSDTTEFTVLRPGKAATPQVLRDAGIQDARTVRLLNQQSAAGARLRTAEANLKSLNAERERLVAGLDDRDIQLAQAGMGDPETAAKVQKLAYLDESIAGTQSEIDLQNATLDEINAKVSGTQQAVEATISAAQEEAATTARLYEEAQARREAAWQELTQKLALGPEAASRRFLDNVRQTDDVFLDTLKGKYTGKRLTQAAYDQLMNGYEEMAKNNVATLSKPAREAFGQAADGVVAALNDMGARQAVSIIGAPTLSGMNAIDPDAMRNGVGGFFRKTIAGTGLSSADAENDLANHLRGQSAAAQMADLGAGQVERHAANLSNKFLEKLASVQEPELNPANFSTPPTAEMLEKSRKAAERGAWARSVIESVKDPMERMGAVLRNAAKPITDHYWVQQLGDVPEQYRQQIYDMLAGNFLHATKNPGAYNYADLDHSFANTLGQYRKQAKSVEDFTGARGLMRNLLKGDFREFEPTGRIPLPDGSVRELKSGDRTDITDLWEILAKADADPKRIAASASGIPQKPPSLEQMMIPAKEWGTTQYANVLNRLNVNATWGRVASKLKDPKVVERLKQGQDIPLSEWKDPAYGQDFGKLRDELNNKPVFGAFQKAADAMNKIAASTITGDGSFAGVQGLIGMAMSPASTAKLLTGYYRNALSDEGWMTLTADPQWRAKFIDRINRGMGVGRSSVTGMDSGGNLFQSIPGLKRVGNVMAAADKITFDRMQTINKMNLIDTMEADVQMLRAFGQGPGQQFVDGIPSLAALNQHVNLWQATPEEISNGIIRQANNALGGLSKSQSLLGRNRQAVESTLLFVPGFFRARGGLINSVSKMLRNPESPEGYLAASLLAREALFRTAFAASVAEVTGTSDEFRKEADSWAAFDPRKSGGMLSGPLGDGGYLGLSWGNQAPKLYAQLLAGNRAGEFNLSPQDRLASIQGFFEGRTNPVLGGIIDQVKGQDFMGRPIQSPRDRMFAALQFVTPMFLSNTAGEANEMQHAGQFDPKTLAAKSGAEFLGLNARAPLPSEQLNSAFIRWQEQNFPGEQPVDWKNAPSGLKNMAREDQSITDAEEAYTTEIGRRVSESASQRDIVYRAWDEKNAGFDDAIGKLSQQLSAGQISPEDFKASYSSLQEDRADAASDFRAVLAKAGIQPKDEVGQLGSAGSQLAHLMAEYNAIKPQTISGQKITDAGVVPDNDIDWTRFKQERQAVLNRYPPEVQARFEATQQSDDPNVRRLQDSRGVLDTYFDQLPKYRGLSNVEGKTLDAYKSILNASASQYSDLGVKVDRQAMMIQTLQKMEQNGQIQNPRQAQIAALAMKAALDPKFAVSIRDLSSVQYLLQNSDVFQWYPWLESEVPSMLRPLLGGGAPVDTNAILQRELRGADLSGVR